MSLPYYQKAITVENFKNYFFLNCKLPVECIDNYRKNFRRKKNCSLYIKFILKIKWKNLPTTIMSFISALKTETNDLFTKRAICQNLLERPHNVTSILHSFKSLIKQVYQKECAQNLTRKWIKKPKSLHITYRKNYLHWNNKKTDWFLIITKFSFLMSQFSKIKFTHTCMC